MTIKEVKEINGNWNMKTITTKRKKEEQMKSVRTKIMVFMLMALAALLAPGMAMALGTTAAGIVNNTASLSYQVLTVPQTPVTNSAAFTVDRKVNFNVSRVADGIVSPGFVNGVLEFFVANNSNAQIGFLLSLESIGGTPINMTGTEIWYETNATPGFQYGADTQYTGTSVDLAAGATADISNVTVYIVADTPGTALNGQTEIFALIANAVEPSSTTAILNTAGVNNILGAADDVLAEGDGPATIDAASYDGIHSASATFTVAGAVLDVTKTFVGVISDPINGATANAKAIPGAIVEYQVVVTHLSGTEAVLTTLVDAIDAADVGDMVLTTFGAGHHIEMTCTILGVDAGSYACEGAGTTFTLPAGGITEVAGTSLTFNMATLLPAAGGTHLTNGELEVGESVTFKYRMLIQ